jgi:shikimate dehydrogenase
MTTNFAVIGHPISHSMSPEMHNSVFKKLGLDCKYTLFDIPSSDLERAISDMRSKDFGGFNVTIPHKVAVIKHLDSLSKEARIIGAVNTVKISDSLKGYNTDGIGALEALINNGADPKGKKVVILGSGGAARAISVTLAMRGGAREMTIIGIDPVEFRGLTEDIEKGTGLLVKGASMDDVKLQDEILSSDILIHATPVGMHPKVNDTVIKAGVLKEDMVVLDIVYNPLETQLMREAKKAGVKTIIGGVDMFVNQGAEALRIWLDIKPPVELMRQTVIRELMGK